MLSEKYKYAKKKKNQLQYKVRYLQIHIKTSKGNQAIISLGDQSTPTPCTDKQSVLLTLTRAKSMDLLPKYIKYCPFLLNHCVRL